MEIAQHTDPVAFQHLVTPFLLRDEPRFNLELAIVGRLAKGETFGGEPPLLLRVGDGMAFMTPPHNLGITAIPPEAATPLAEWIVEHGYSPPGVLGAPATARAFAQRYTTLSGRAHRIGHEQAAFKLTTLVEPRPTTGALRLATMDDSDLVVAWWEAFQIEAHLRPLARAEDAVRRIAQQLQWLWVDGDPVCLVGCGGYTPHGARIGPVYTPPERRNRGYASAATAAVTRLLLERGLAHTFLFTDLANPTSNKIYQAIGYEHVADVSEVLFE